MLDDFTETKIEVSKNIVINMKQSGEGFPILLLHGYPQTHLIWHKIAPMLAKKYSVIMPDLRGYGDSSKPASDETHQTYSKRAMAEDIVKLMEKLGHKEFFVVGHDRGARVAYRLAKDYPNKVKKLVLLDMLPTLHVFENVNMDVANAYYHWFFLIQPDGLPEKMIEPNAKYYITEKLRRWSKIGLSAFPQTILDEYLRCSTSYDAIHAACEDYRAAATIDLEHDRADKEIKINCPLYLIWAKNGFIGKHYDVLKVWQEFASSVEGKAIDCGHFIPEEAPDEVYKVLKEWL